MSSFYLDPDVKSFGESFSFSLSQLDAIFCRGFFPRLQLRMRRSNMNVIMAEQEYRVRGHCSRLKEHKKLYYHEGVCLTDAELDGDECSEPMSFSDPPSTIDQDSDTVIRSSASDLVFSDPEQCSESLSSKSATTEYWLESDEDLKLDYDSEPDESGLEVLNSSQPDDAEENNIIVWWLVEGTCPADEACEKTGRSASASASPGHGASGERTSRRSRAPPVDPFDGESDILFEDWMPGLLRAAEWNDWSEH